MIEPILHALKELPNAFFKINSKNYENLQFVKSFREYVIDALKVVRGWLVVILLYILAEQIYTFFKITKTSNFEYDGVIIVTFVIVCLPYYFCNLAIKKIENSIQIEKFFLENNKLQIDKIYTQTISIENKISKNNDVSFRFFSSWSNEQQNYTQFIEKLQSTIHIEPQELTSIAEIAKKSTFGHFMCVISYLDFFKNEDEFKEMINYFSKYEIAASVKKNIVQRIFTIPGNSKDDDGFYKTIWKDENKINNFYLLCYLILNKLCACDAYLLVYDKAKRKLLENRFLVDVDYVLAFKSQDGDTDEQVELYFAYPEEGELNRTIKITDSYFIRMFEIDFNNRMKLEPSDETPTTLFKFNKGNYNKILKMLHIDPNDENDKIQVNNLLEKVKNILLINQFFNQAVVNKIDDWKIKHTGAK